MASSAKPATALSLQAIIVPHAGYIYSGPSRLSLRPSGCGEDTLRRVVCLGRCIGCLCAAGTAGVDAFETAIGRDSAGSVCNRLHHRFAPGVVNSAAMRWSTLGGALPFLHRCSTISSWCLWRSVMPAPKRWRKCWTGCGAGRDPDCNQFRPVTFLPYRGRAISRSANRSKYTRPAWSLIA